MREAGFCFLEYVSRYKCIKYFKHTKVVVKIFEHMGNT